MKQITGSIWDHLASGVTYLCVTTNGIVKRDGALVMGAGIAAQAKQRFPELPVVWGAAVRQLGNRPHRYVIRESPPQTLLSFPTKHHWRDPSDTALIRESALRLMELLQPTETVVLPRPGCGLGGLDWESQVQPLLAPILDDRVTIISPA